MTSAPRRDAASAFRRPAPSPDTSTSVLPLTALCAIPPASVTQRIASARVMPGTVPVTTTRKPSNARASTPFFFSSSLSSPSSNGSTRTPLASNASSAATFAGSAKNSPIVNATAGPTPSMDVNRERSSCVAESSSLASSSSSSSSLATSVSASRRAAPRNASSVTKRRASAFAVSRPTPRIPSANRNRESGTPLDATSSSASNSFKKDALSVPLFLPETYSHLFGGSDFRSNERGASIVGALSTSSPIPPVPESTLLSNDANRVLSVNRSAGDRTTRSSQKAAICALARPGTSSASLETKCAMRSVACAGQRKPPVHRRTAAFRVTPFPLESNGEARTAAPHEGHSLGGRYVKTALLSSSSSVPSASKKSSATPTTRGMTSPARSTRTRLPTARCKFFRSRSEKLCSVARRTEAPPSSAGGFKMATGVNAPVRPTCTSMAASVVTAAAARNLCAVAHRGARASDPSARCNDASSTLYTTPSTAYPKEREGTFFWSSRYPAFSFSFSFLFLFLSFFGAETTTASSSSSTSETRSARRIANSSLSRASVSCARSTASTPSPSASVGTGSNPS
mmetsp:Transcript_2138/g.8411  ORF Transcript_2138/g.8411 Transcript_2138/m.8411 type:complete len:571 (-) Transcript_2138:1186-2898(-)